MVLVGRCEAYLMETLDLDEVIRRLKAYGAARDDCLYAPSLRALELIARVDKPVNANLTATGLSVADLAGVGVRRVSVGATLPARQALSL
jgi:2-methylisocitrate lyase-like PEP mutase family enzyme